jgi:hypothetical protein
MPTYTTNPIDGNQFFSRVGNVSSGSAPETNYTYDLSVENLTVNRSLSQLLLPGIGASQTGVVHETVLYAPAGFNEATQNSVSFLMKKPGTTAATSLTSAGLFVLPLGARIVSAVATNNGTTVVGGTTFDVGYEAWNDEPTGNGQIFTALTVARLNTGGFVGPVAATALGSAGTSFAIGSATTEATSITVQVLGAANTAGDFALVLRYLL